MSHGGGSHKHTISKPGFHLKPKYDLQGTRKHVKGEHKSSPIAELQLTSMIDMFTILVIFLLMNFSATGEIFFIPKKITLPEAKHAIALKSAPLITITETNVILETEKVGDNPVTVNETDLNLPKLAAALKEIRGIEEASHPGQPFKGNVNIQADEKTPLIHIKRVMQTCITEGWTGINFAVRGDESKPPSRETASDEAE